MACLQEVYKKETVPELMAKFGYKSVMQVPRITKITLNMGLGEAVADKKIIESAASDLGKIAGQKPIPTLSRKAIAGFNKLREGVAIGLKVTLRGQQMWDFYERLVHIAFPRVRDFRGVSSRLDGRGGFNCGVVDQSMFPEVESQLDVRRGLNISITTSAKTDEEAKALLAGLKFPFKK